MKKEEILEKSRKENKKKDMQAVEVEAKAGTYACIAMLFLALFYFTHEIVTGKGVDPAIYSLVTIVNTIIFGYKAIKLEKNRKINMFTSVIWGILTISLILEYLGVI